MTSGFQLPALPSSLQNITPAAPTMALATANPTEVLTKPVTLQLNLEGPRYDAQSHVAPRRLEQIRAWSASAVRDPGFNPAFMANYARAINLDTAILETVLENTRALNAGEIGKLTVEATRYMDQVKNRIPTNVVDQRFIERVQQQQVRFQEIIDKVVRIARMIEDALRQYQSLAIPIAQVEAKLQEKYDLMFQAIVLNNQLAENEDDQTDELVSHTATLESLLEAIDAYVVELRGKLADAPIESSDINATITRLNGIKPLVTKALMMLKPMIATGNNAVQRYLNLANMAGGHALVLGLFLTAGLYRWKSDIVTQLQEMQLMAVGLAEVKLEQTLNEQAQQSAGMYKQAVQQYVDMLTRWTTTVETMEKITQASRDAQQLLANGYGRLNTEYQKTSSAVEDAMTQIAHDQDEYNVAIERLSLQS